MSAAVGPNFSATDHAMMARALALAERGLYTTKPNPMVGCVIAQGERVVGEGYHVRAGQPQRIRVSVFPHTECQVGEVRHLWHR